MRLEIRKRWIELLGWIADRHRGSALAALLLLGVLAAMIRAPMIDGALVDRLGGANEQLEAARHIEAALGGRSAAAVILEARDTAIGAAFADLAGLRSTLEAIDDAIELRSIDEAEPQLFAYDLTATDPLGKLLGVLAENPQSATIIGRDARQFLVVISLPRALEDAVLAALAEHDWGPRYARVSVLADAQLERDVAASLAKDLRLLIPVIVAVTLLAIFAAFSNWRALLLPLYASIASTVATFALFSIAVVSINLVTLIALPVVLIVGLANSCHFLAKSDAHAAARENVRLVVRQTLQRIGPPFFFSTLTTAIALASLGFNELRPIANLGLLSAAALLIVFVLVLLAAPLLLRIYLSASQPSWQASRPYAALSRWLWSWRIHVSALLLLAMLGGAVAAPLLTVKSDPRAFFPDAAPFASTLRLFEREFYAFSPLFVLVRPAGDDRLQGLRGAGRVRDALTAHAGVREVRLQPAADDDNAYVLSALLTTEHDLDAVRERLEQFDASDDLALEYSSASLVYSDIDRQAMESLLESLGWSVALIFAAVLVAFRSLRVMLATMVANAVPLALVCGAVWLIGDPLNLVTVFVFLVALGIVVDDAIHILFWRAAGDRVSGSSVEFSVLLSTFMLCLGLLLCQLSDFPTTRQFASYCAFALVGAVVSNLTLLPLLLGHRSDVEVFDR